MIFIYTRHHLYAIIYTIMYTIIYNKYRIYYDKHTKIEKIII